jgi:hypothetical protein
VSKFAAIKRLARFYDSIGKPEQEITVYSTRRYLLRVFKPIKRGGSLMYRKHPIVPLDKPEAIEHDQLPLMGPRA